MNSDLIKKLAEQASFTYTMRNAITAKQDGVPIESLEAFARQVVLECAQRAGELRHVYPHQAELTKDSILKHFGVTP